ncbi:restriction endonuclease [Coralloluteibacterium stylophorae]|uniref:Restriction endonuclease n=1 Tax=Coralloluteibacterium stylophorae TaxID=1776034 RepID=A0A8J8AXE2_9GAMM|nr:restriction endonuclease [Coralloluteibacterium stylophorae]MBS7455805.1 restriction endonuclease [Coralloluteibacterium stylophorae]
MSGIALLAGLGIALVAAAGVAWQIGIVGRRRADARLGVAAMAAMKWRELAVALRAAMRREGYFESRRAEAPRPEDGFDFALVRDGVPHLLACKHGTAYRLRAAAVAEFDRTLGMHGAGSGTLATLGRIEDDARRRRNVHDVTLLDGEALWWRLRADIPTETLAAIEAQVARDTRRQLAIGVGASATLGLLAFLALNPLLRDLDGRRDQAVVSAPVAAPRTGPAAPPPVADAPQVLDEAELQRRRTAVTVDIRALPGVASASWATASTLVLDPQDAGGQADDAPLIAEVCRLLGRYRELDMTRIQLVPPQGSGVPVRWRRCQGS